VIRRQEKKKFPPMERTSAIKNPCARLVEKVGSSKKKKLRVKQVRWAADYRNGVFGALVKGRWCRRKYCPRGRAAERQLRDE